jgi:hypothetical protein
MNLELREYLKGHRHKIRSCKVERDSGTHGGWELERYQVVKEKVLKLLSEIPLQYSGKLYKQ